MSRLKLIQTLFVLLIVSCESPLIEDIGLKDYRSEVVVNAALLVGEPPMVKVTKSQEIQGGGPFDIVNDASVQLIFGDTVEDLEFTSERFYSSQSLVQSNTSYQVIVVTRDELVFSGEDITPIPVSLDSVGVVDTLYIQPGEASGNGFSSDVDAKEEVVSGLTVSILDPPGSGNAYELITYQVLDGRAHLLDMSTTNLNIDNVNTSSVLQSSNNEFTSKFLFEDGLFNGESFKMEIEFKKIDQKAPVVVHLKSLSKTYYNHLLSRFKAQQTNDDFTEPIRVHSNIENGKGMLVGYGLVEVTRGENSN